MTHLSGSVGSPGTPKASDLSRLRVLGTDLSPPRETCPPGCSLRSPSCTCSGDSGKNFGEGAATGHMMKK